MTLVSTPLYSNTTLVVFIPTLAHGGTAVLLPKFDAGEFLRLSEKHRVTHAMLVPVQYRRIVERPDFGDYDLSSYLVKFSTSAPFSAALKADVLRRWPGGLVEYLRHDRRRRLDNACRPSSFRTNCTPSASRCPTTTFVSSTKTGREVAQGEIGEVVGSSGDDDDRVSQPA